MSECRARQTPWQKLYRHLASSCNDTVTTDTSLHTVTTDTSLQVGQLYFMLSLPASESSVGCVSPGVTHSTLDCGVSGMSNTRPPHLSHKGGADVAEWYESSTPPAARHSRGRQSPGIWAHRGLRDGVGRVNRVALGRRRRQKSKAPSRCRVTVSRDRPKAVVVRLGGSGG